MPPSSEPHEAPAIVTFAIEMEHWRTEAGLSKRKLAELLGYTEQYLGQVELCKSIPGPDFARALDTFFKTNGLFERLWKRIDDTRHLAILPPGFTEYLGYEPTAISVRSFSPILIDGLLQAESYARTVYSANRLLDRVDQLVEDRLKRAEVLTRAHAYFTMDEAVLRRVVGGPDIMREQLTHLLELSEQPNVSIDVVPASVGFYGGISGMFYVLGLEDGSSIAYTESSGEGVMIKQPAHVAKFAIRYDSVRGHALSVEESRILIKRAMEEL